MSSRNHESSQCWRARFWSVCSVAAICLSKRLLEVHGYHYPLTIAFRTYDLLLLIYATTLWFSEEEPTSRWRLRRPNKEFLWPNEGWLDMFPAAVTAAASLPMLLEGILHMPSLTVLVMAFPVIYVSESLVLFIFCHPSRSQRCSLPWESFVVAATSALVVYCEYRLKVPGIFNGLVSMILIGVSRAFFTIGSGLSASDSIQKRVGPYHAFVFMTLTLGLGMSAFTGHLFEQKPFKWAPSSSTLGLMVVTIMLIVASICSGTSLLAYSPISLSNAQPEYSSISGASSDFHDSVVASIITLLIATQIDPIPVVSLAQAAGYFTSIAIFYTAIIIFSNSTPQFSNSRFTYKHIQTPKAEKDPLILSSKLLTTICLFLFVLAVFSSWAVSYMSLSAISSLPIGPTSTLDLTYHPQNRFDIVVSMYDENPLYVKRTIEALKSTTFLSTLTPNIIIYTKNPQADLTELKDITNATHVERLENTGREGGTYLHHIVDKWDNLAEQTMFIQAHPHNMRELIPRINEYLVSQTGMLALGFTGMTCDCERCFDREGWSDDFSLFPKLYTEIYSRNCEPNHRLLLTYKGQFVASSRRIRGVKKFIFERLLLGMTDKNGWGHDRKKIGKTAFDTLDNPFLGFSVERIWGLLMQCADNAQIAAKCPSLLSGIAFKGNVGDCQCLDEVSR